MKTDANDIHREHGDEGLRHAFDEAATKAKPNGHAADEPQEDDRPFYGEPTGGQGVKIQTSAEFVRSLRMPDYIVDGLLQRGFLYSFTGQTGALKTTILLRLLAHVAEGRQICGHEVERGRCLMLVGENPDDVKARWLALAEQMGFDDKTIEVHFIEGIFNIAEALPQISATIKGLGGVDLVGVDTSPAYFLGEEENSNRELGNHARMLRRLTNLEKRPCVIATCHPTKTAKNEESLLPRGGGAYLCEVDGNLTSQKTDNIAKVHWAGKFRGPEFAPIYFEHLTVNSPRLVNSRGREMPTVVVRPLSDDETQGKNDAVIADKRKLLAALAENPRASIARLAEVVGWKLGDGSPHKTKVVRRLAAMAKERLIEKDALDETYTLTNSGKKAASSRTEA